MSHMCVNHPNRVAHFRDLESKQWICGDCTDALFQSRVALGYHHHSALGSLWNITQIGLCIIIVLMLIDRFGIWRLLTNGMMQP